MKIRLIAIGIAWFVLVSGLWQPALRAQEPTGHMAAVQPLRVVDIPTAGLLARGSYGIDLDVYSEGGVLFEIEVGISRFANIGISYGGIEFIGSGTPDMNPRPEVQARVRILEEDEELPAVAIGFDSQGYGQFVDNRSICNEKRYLVKSRGFYVVGSKNWEVVGPFSLHGGISYSLENKLDKSPTIFIGAIKSFSNILDIALELDPGWNDDKGCASIVEHRPYIDAAVAWHVNQALSIAFEVRDVASREKDVPPDLRKWNRGLRVCYRSTL
jgi:hypothetical protein